MRQHPRNRMSAKRLVGVLELNSKYLFGFTSRNVPLYLFHPYAKEEKPLRVGCSERDRTQNLLVWVEKDEKNPERGILVQRLGPVGDWKAEKQALLLHASIPRPKDFLWQPSVSASESGRHRLTGKTINIDPVGCRDIDDVFTLSQDSENPDIWRWAITIADVAAWMPEGSPEDLYAQKQGQTIYQEGVAVAPLFPVALSEDSASLLAGQERLGISLMGIWNRRQGCLSQMEWKETIVYNSQSYTYESICETKEEEFPVSVLRDIASSLKGQRIEDSHEWIEQLMLLYNREAAKILVDAGGGLLRHHSPPQQEQLQRYQELLPELTFLGYSSALYYDISQQSQETAPLLHWGLGNIQYAHVSSPLRRYADLFNQRFLKRHLSGGGKVVENGGELAKHLNLRQKVIKRHDRDIFFLEQVRQSNIGSNHGLTEGIVLEEIEKKLSVYIPSWGRIVKVKVVSEEQWKPKQRVAVEYYYQKSAPRWKERMVFRLKSSVLEEGV